MNLQNEVTKLEKMIFALEQKHEKLSAKIDSRNEKFAERSEKWQESEKGTDYEVDTDLMQSDYNDIEEVIHSLQNSLEELSAINEN